MSTENPNIIKRAGEFIRAKKGKKVKAARPRPAWVKKLSELCAGPVLGNPFVQVAIIALLNILYIEGLGYKDPIGGLRFLVAHPYAFLANTLMIYATLSLAWLSRRRVFYYAFISLWWIVLGTVNGMALMSRMTPFTVADLQIIGMAFDMLPNYLSQTGIVLAAAGLLLVIAGFVLLFIFSPKYQKRIDYRKAGLGIIASVLIFIASLQIGTRTGLLDVYFENLWDAYIRNGAPYCFVVTWLDKGIDRPPGYSQGEVQAIVEEDGKEIVPEGLPNLVFLQLESFIDPDELTAYKYTETATPYFKELKEKYSSGHLQVPVVGGGTANTEFEVMSGMSMKFFGPGEYPYKSVLKQKTCETFAYLLKELGFGTHAIHNHRGAFYNRDTIFANLGFDDFTSLEYMNYIGKTPKNYAKDDVLEGEILGALASTESHDYIYCISVQGHGDYPKTKLIPDPPVRIDETDGPVPEEKKNAYEYYLTEVREMDDFLRSLTATLADYEEPVVLVLYGDHLPALDMKDEETAAGSIFETEYVIWTNFDFEKQDKDLAAFQLTAEVQRRLGMKKGTLFSYNQTREKSPSYRTGLQALQYDMLYGAEYVYDGSSPFEPVNMQMGYRPIKIESIRQIGGEYYIVGTGFTPYSKVSLDGDILGTVYLGPTLLKLDKEIDPAEAPNMKVSQVEKYDKVLSTTE